MKARSKPPAAFPTPAVFRDAGGGDLRERVEYRLPWGTWGELLGELMFGATRAIENVLELRYTAVSRRFANPWPRGRTEPPLRGA